jgi:hypothetical protein
MSLNDWFPKLLGETVVEFTPTKAGDEAKAKNATDYINYLFYKKNPGYSIVWLVSTRTLKSCLVMCRMIVFKVMLVQRPVLSISTSRLRSVRVLLILRSY